jgi:ubiquinone biosynthesis protein UbiJ
VVEACRRAIAECKAQLFASNFCKAKDKAWPAAFVVTGELRHQGDIYEEPEPNLNDLRKP